MIALIDNPTSYENYKELVNRTSQFSDTLENNGDIISCSFPFNLQLGELQSGYTQFLKSYKEYKNFIEIDYHKKKIGIIKKQIEAKKMLKILSEKQLSISKEQMDISDKTYKRDILLFNQNVLSQVDIEKSKSNQLSTKQKYETAQADLNNIKIDILQLEQTLFDLELDREEKISLLERSLTGNFDNLRAEIKQWEQHICYKPVNESYPYKILQETQKVSTGRFFHYNPSQEAKKTAKIYLPIAGAGK